MDVNLVALEVHAGIQVKGSIIAKDELWLSNAFFEGRDRSEERRLGNTG